MGKRVTKQEAPFADNSSPRQSTGIGRFLLVFLWRLLLLGVGGGLAWLFGLVLAGVFPDLTPEVPLVVKVLRRAKPETSTASSTFKPSSAVTSASPPVELSAEQRRQLQAELQQLQADLQALRDRTSKLETQVGRDSSERRTGHFSGQLLWRGNHSGAAQADHKTCGCAAWRTGVSAPLANVRPTRGSAKPEGHTHFALALTPNQPASIWASFNPWGRRR